MSDKPRFIAACLALLLLGSAGTAPATRPSTTRPAAATTTRPAAPDLSTAQGAARAYVEAMTAGDAKTLRAVTSGDARAHEQAEASAANTQATFDLAAALAEKFGDEGRRFVPGQGDERRRLLDRVRTARVVVEGDIATLLDPESGWLLTLRKDASGWKIDLPKALEKEDHDRVLGWMNGKAAMTRELAAEVRAGRYATIGDVEAAQRERARRLSASQLNSQSTLGPAAGEK